MVAGERLELSTSRSYESCALNQLRLPRPQGFGRVARPGALSPPPPWRGGADNANHALSGKQALFTLPRNCPVQRA